MNLTRRDTLLSGLFGAGWLGLRSLATGLPIALLANPRQAFAADECTAGKAQFIILSTSSSGDPMNANVPGTYEIADIAHSANPTMAPKNFTMRGVSYKAATPWTTLPQATLDRTVFFHHTTLTNNHGNQPKVMRLMGAVRRQEMLVSLLAKQLQPCLGTVQAEPAVVGAAGPTEFLSAGGRVLPNLPPTGLKDILTAPNSPLTKLQDLRDKDINRLNALYKQSGTPAQKAFLDRLVRSQSEARSLSQSLLNDLAMINSNNVAGQVLAAVLLIKMKVAPVVSIRLPFGGDNHTDGNLQNESNQHVSSLAAINDLMVKLKAQGLEDKVTFVAMNVFGRTMSFKRKGLNGRDHLGSHHCTVMIGKNLKGGVIGGVTAMGGDYGALPIDSKTGKSQVGADIAFDQTLGAVGKTLGLAVGVSQKVLDEQVTTGKPVSAALV